MIFMRIKACVCCIFVGFIFVMPMPAISGFFSSEKDNNEASDVISAEDQADAITGGGASGEEKSSGEAESFVMDLSDKVLSIINDTNTSDEEKEKKLREFFVNSVDTEWMGKFVLGRYFRTASEEQKQQYMTLYHDYLIWSYVPRFKEYKGGSFYIIKVKEESSGNDAIVQTEMRGIKESPNIRVDYMMHRNGDGNFKIIDIVGEGISLITTQRSDFGGMISQKGLDYFISKLESKVNSLKKKSA